jgi:hypothetical protein
MTSTLQAFLISSLVACNIAHRVEVISAPHHECIFSLTSSAFGLLHDMLYHRFIKRPCKLIVVFAKLVHEGIAQSVVFLFVVKERIFIDRRVLLLSVTFTFDPSLVFQQRVQGLFDTLHDGIIFVYRVLLIVVVGTRFIDQTLLVKSVKFVHAVHSDNVKYTEALKENRYFYSTIFANKVGFGVFIQLEKHSVTESVHVKQSTAYNNHQWTSSHKCWLISMDYNIRHRETIK